MLKEGYTLPFQTRPSCYVHLRRNLYPLEATNLSADKHAVELVSNQIWGFTTGYFLVPKNKQQMETYAKSEQSQQIPQGRKIQNGDTRNVPDLPTDRGVGDVHRVQGHLLLYTHTKPQKKISEISCTGQTIPV